MGLVGRDEGSTADAERVSEGVVDLAAVVAGLVVEEKRDGGCARGRDAVSEGLDDGGGVLGGSDRGAGEPAGVGVDEQLQVDGEALAVEGDPQLGAVADPLGAGEEGQKPVTVRRGVDRSAAPLGGPHRVGGEDVADVLAAEGDAEVEPDVVTEGREAALLVVPALPGVEDGLDAGRARVGDGGEVVGCVDLGPLAA